MKKKRKKKEIKTKNESEAERERGSGGRKIYIMKGINRHHTRNLFNFSCTAVPSS